MVPDREGRTCAHATDDENRHHVCAPETLGVGPLRDLTAALNSSETVKLLRGSTVPVVLALVGPLLPKDVTTLLPTGLPGRLPFPTPKP